jgi:hypothetical protein
MDSEICDSEIGQAADIAEMAGERFCAAARCLGLWGRAASVINKENPGPQPAGAPAYYYQTI